MLCYCINNLLSNKKILIVHCFLVIVHPSSVSLTETKGGYKNETAEK